MSIDNKKRLQNCILANFGLLLTIALTTIIFRDNNDTYFRLGPNNNLYIMSIKINTKIRYLFLQVFLCLSEIVRVIVNEIASPILGFNIYNPDKKIITEFSKNELQIMANCMWTINSLISVLFIMVTISQIDIAILKVIYSELTSIYTIRLLLNEKEFKNEISPNVDEDQIELLPV